MPRVHLNIGSNLGNRRENIARVVDLCRQLALDLTTFRVSTPVESEPWGYDSPNRFINVGISFDTDLSPYDLLKATRKIERSISPKSHRRTDGSYADRLIDIDIILYGTERISTPTLTIPHPHASERPFVMRPLQEIDPDLAAQNALAPRTT